MDFILNLAMMAPPSVDGEVKPQQSLPFMLVWMGVMLVLFYFMLIRARKRRKK